MSKYLMHDVKAACRAFNLVFRELVRYQQEEIERIWSNSSLKSGLEENAECFRSSLKNISKENLAHILKESYERASMITHGLKVYATTPSLYQTNKTIKEKVDTGNINLLNSQKILPKGITPEDLQVSELHDRDKKLIEKLEREYEEKLKQEIKNENIQSFVNISTETMKSQNTIDTKNKEDFLITKKYIPKRQELNPEAKQRKVPSSRIARMVSFGSLAAGIGIGAIAEATRRALDFTSNTSEKNLSVDQLILTEANAERIVNTLCRVRGAALKIGQIFSIQDSTIINPVLQKAFERVRQSADFMPTWQVHKVLVNELGPNWRDKLTDFEEKPFAAASIGQVHHIKLKDGRECAMKIQYPGVAQGIESDINNLVGILKVWNVFPQGLFIDNLVDVAKRELAWEVDYAREAECTKKFKTLLSGYPDYIVPEVIDELSTKQIFTSTLVEGMPVDQCTDLEEEHKERIARLILQLCLKEIFEFLYMQTDPNWSNFYYEPNSRKISLLDFGATRSYDCSFVKKYIEVIKAAADGDREKVLKLSEEMGFLTGYESKNMKNAHVDAVMILAEVLSAEKPFDFGQQDTTKRIHKLVPTIVAERLCPPPEEIYSLHRKLSGVFLLCAKLKVKISCREMFNQVYNNFAQTKCD